MTTVTDLFGKLHIIKECKFDDVPLHFQRIKEVIPEAEHGEFCVRMDNCINERTAFAISDDSCFIYYIKTSPEFAEGVALYGKGVPHKMLALFAGVFGEIDPTVFKMDFKLHPGKFVTEYKSILTKVSVIRMYNENRPVSVRVDKLKEKIYNLYDRKGIQPHG